MRLFENKFHRWGYLNLNELAVDFNRRNKIRQSDKNPLLLPRRCQSMVDGRQHAMDLEASYGGWLEDRSTLWRGSYLEDGGKFIHLGVDFNVPAGTPVIATFHCGVVAIDTDHPEKHGWGTRVIVRTKSEERMIYGHLNPDVRVKRGQILAPGDLIGYVGDATHNGGWFEHLHVQLVSPRAWVEIGISKIDGYGHHKEFLKLARHFPDPLPYVM